MYSQSQISEYFDAKKALRKRGPTPPERDNYKGCWHSDWTDQDYTRAYDNIQRNQSLFDRGVLRREYETKLKKHQEDQKKYETVVKRYNEKIIQASIEFHKKEREQQNRERKQKEKEPRNFTSSYTPKFSTSTASNRGYGTSYSSSAYKGANFSANYKINAPCKFYTGMSGSCKNGMSCKFQHN